MHSKDQHLECDDSETNKKKIGKFHLDEQRVILQVREKSH